MLPEVPHHKLVSLMRILDANRNGFMEREEFELLLMNDEQDLADSILSDKSRESQKPIAGSALVEDGPMIARSLAMKF